MGFVLKLANQVLPTIDCYFLASCALDMGKNHDKGGQ